MTLMKIADIKIGERRRKDLGDIASLAESIKAVGLLHPVVVTRDGWLVAGERRIEAHKLLKREHIEATIADNLDDALTLLMAERDENEVRKSFTAIEAHAVAEALKPYEKQEAAERKATSNTERANLAHSKKGRTRDKVAKATGKGRTTLAKTDEIVKAAKEKPEVYGDLLKKLEKTDKVDPVHKELKKLQRQQEIEQAAEQATLVPVDTRYQLILSDFRTASGLELESLDCIITDPPYPLEYIPLYEPLAEFGAKYLKPGGSMLVMCGQSYLPAILPAMARHLSYQWMLTYQTPGGQSAQLWDRKVNTFWKPVLWFVKGEYAGGWIGDVLKSENNDKRFHHWGQSESGMAQIIERFSKPGDLVCDPFMGGGTTGVVSLKLGRRFIGIEIAEEAHKISQGRIFEALKEAA